jgi:integrase
MKRKRGLYGAGTIDESGSNSYRLRYRIDGKRFSATVRGTKGEAVAKLRELLRSGDTGEHVEPDRITVAAWIDHWMKSGAPGRRRKPVGRRTIERYAQLMRVHVVPELGNRALQKLQSTEIDHLYRGLESKKISPRTAHHVHVVFGACLGAAVRSGILQNSPMERALKIPAPGEANHGDVVDGQQLAALVQGFKGSPLYPIVAVAAFTGARLREVTALRWEDVDLTISRAVEETKGYRGIKAPKTERGLRTFKIDDGLAKMLVAHRENQQRLVAGLPDSADVDLSLIRLPAGALLFPGGDGTDLTKLRDGRAVSRTFKRRAKRLGFSAKLRWHDLRGSHETALLDAGVPLHVVAGRCGHDPAVLLRSLPSARRRRTRRRRMQLPSCRPACWVRNKVLGRTWV